MAYSPSSSSYVGMTPQQYGQMAQRQANPDTTPATYVSPFAGGSGGFGVAGGGAPTLSYFRNMSPDQLLRLRLQDRLAAQAPALQLSRDQMAQQDRQFGANLGFDYSQLASQNMWNQLNNYYNLLGRLF